MLVLKVSFIEGGTMTFQKFENLLLDRKFAVSVALSGRVPSGRLPGLKAWAELSNRFAVNPMDSWAKSSNRFTVNPAASKSSASFALG
jgi:hypothetical protein